MATEDYDINTGTWGAGGGAGVGARFELRAVKDEAASEAAGVPQYVDVEYVRLLVSGDKYNVPFRPAREDDKRRFAQEYAAFKRGLSAKRDGFAIEEWPVLTRATAENLKVQGYYTVEQIAAVEDAKLGELGPYADLRDRAKAYLARGAASVDSSALKNENADLKRKLADALAAQEAASSGKRK